MFIFINLGYSTDHTTPFICVYVAPPSIVVEHITKAIKSLCTLKQPILFFELIFTLPVEIQAGINFTNILQ